MWRVFIPLRSRFPFALTTEKLQAPPISKNSFRIRSWTNMAALDHKIPLKKLNDGHSIPMIGYGTGTAWYKSDESASLDQTLIDATVIAIKQGYYHLDGAETYKTEAELGAAIKKSGVPRDQLFITTKVSPSIQDIPGAISTSLKKLGLTYVDLFLIHEPYFAAGDLSVLQQKWRDMEGVQRSGQAKSIGVSNYLRPELEATLKIATVVPALNQIEFHPYLQHRGVDGDLLEFMRGKGIAVAAYGPLTPVSRASDGPLQAYLAQLAKKYAVTPAEVLLRWCLELDVVAVTTSAKEQRLSDYLRCLAFKLTPKEIKEICSIGETHHYRAFWNKKFDKEDRS